MAMEFQQILPTWAVATGVAYALTTYVDPLIASGLINADNLDTVEKRSEAGYTLVRMDNCEWNTGLGYRDRVPADAAFPVESQVTVPWNEIHNVNKKVGDIGMVLDSNMIDGNYGVMSDSLKGYKLLLGRTAQAVSAIYAGHLNLGLKNIFEDHYVRSNDAADSSIIGTAVSFANDVTNAAVTLDVDLTATPTYMGETGEKLYKFFRESGRPFTDDRSGRVLFYIVNNSTYEPMKLALDSFDRMGRSIKNVGDETRDGIKYTAYQPYMHMNDICLIGVPDSFLPRTTLDDGYRCLITTGDGIRMAVVRRAFESSITAMGMSVSGGVQYAQQNSMDFNTLMAELTATNPALPLINAEESGRISINNIINRGMLGQSALLNCITMSLERIPAIPGMASATHYLLFGQMWSTMARNNPDQLRELTVPDTMIPTVFKGATAKQATTRSRKMNSIEV